MIIPSIIYFILSIAFTYPLVLKLGNFLPGPPNDVYVYLWNVWNFWNQIWQGANIFHSFYVMYPIGANLFFHTYAPLVSIVLLPFLNNLSLGMGVLIIFSVCFSCISAYILIKKITQNRVSAFIGGGIYGLSPIINSFIESQHFYFLFSSIFYPLGILFSITYVETRKNKYLIYILLIFWCIFFIDYYSAILYTLLIGIFFLTAEKINFKSLAKHITNIFFVIFIPFLLIYLTQVNFREFIQFKQLFNSSSSCNTNIAGFILPNEKNPFLGNLSNRFRSNLDMDINLDTPSYFLGWGILLILLFSIVKSRKNKYFWSYLIIFVFFIIMSLGTSIHFGNSILLSSKLTPFFYFLKLPIMKAVDCPIRFPIVTQLIAAIFISIFITKLKNKKILLVIISVILFIEYAVVNTNFSSTNIPEIYSNIVSDKNNKTLLELPSGISESKGAFGYDWSIPALHSKQMYWQTAYKKPRVGVYMSRLTDKVQNYFKTEPIISDLFELSSIGGVWPGRNYSETEVGQFIYKFNLGYIILSPNDRQKQFAEIVENLFKNKIKEKRDSDGYVQYKLIGN